MKIDKILPSGLNAEDKRSTASSEKPAGTSFEQVLEEAKNSYREGKTVSATQEAGLIQAPMPVVPLQLTESVSQALSMAEDSLNALEKFGDLLASPGVSANKLAAAVREMDGNVRKMDELVGLLPKDSSLRTIMEQISTLAAKEIARYERGDYNM